MNASFSWLSLLVTAAIVALLVQGFRMAPAGRIGMVLKVLCGLLIAWILVVVVWNTFVILTRSK